MDTNTTRLIATALPAQNSSPVQKSIEPSSSLFAQTTSVVTLIIAVTFLLKALTALVKASQGKQ